MPKRPSWQVPSSNSSADDLPLPSSRRAAHGKLAACSSSWQTPVSSSSSPERVVRARSGVICVSSSESEADPISMGSGVIGRSSSGSLAAQPKCIVDVDEAALLGKVGLDRQPRQKLNSYESHGCCKLRIRDAMSSKCCSRQCLASIDHERAAHVCAACGIAT
jgi:hypothetical protein